MPDEKRPSVYSAATVGEVFQCIVEDVRQAYVADCGRSPDLTRNDLIDAPSFGARFRNPPGRVSRHIADNLTGVARSAIVEGQPPLDSDAFIRSFLSELNSIIHGRGDALFDPARFQDILLRPATQSLVARRDDASVIPMLNRLLLEDTYPREIRRLSDRASVLLNTIDLELKFQSVTVNEKGWALFGKDTEQSQMKIRLATQLTPPSRS